MLIDYWQSDDCPAQPGCQCLKDLHIRNRYRECNGGEGLFVSLATIQVVGVLAVAVILCGDMIAGDQVRCSGPSKSVQILEIHPDLSGYAELPLKLLCYRRSDIPFTVNESAQMARLHPNASRKRILKQPPALQFLLQHLPRMHRQ